MQIPQLRPRPSSVTSQRFSGWSIYEKRAFWGLIVFLAIWGVVDVRKRAATSVEDFGVHKTDLTVFTGAGAVFFTDEDPYEYENPRFWKYCYLPMLAIAMSPLAALDTQTQAVIWYLISLAFGYGCWQEGKRLYFHFTKTPENSVLSGRAIAWASILVAALPAINCMQRGQVGMLLAYLLMLGFRLFIEHRTWLHASAGAILLSLAAVVKLLPALCLSILAVISMAFQSREFCNHRDFGKMIAMPAAGALGLILFIFVIPGTLVGHDKNWLHLQTFHHKISSMAVKISDESQMETPYTPKNQSFSNALYRFGNLIDYKLGDGQDDRIVDLVHVDPDRRMAMDAPWVPVFTNAVRLSVVGIVFALALAYGRRQNQLGMAAALGLSSAACLIVSPMSRGHYFMMLLPAVLLTACWLNSRKLVNKRNAIFAQVSLWVPPALVSLHYIFLYAGAGRAGLLGLGITAWFFVNSAFMLYDAVMQRNPHQEELDEPTSDAELRMAA